MLPDQPFFFATSLTQKRALYFGAISLGGIFLSRLACVADVFFFFFFFIFDI